ncbi:hypothetical protein NDU88_005575 [Pleurodeles waltl]|uniref:Uncharacterized protein n=1 Tax=Pleurodeles waltl TaxID=8319 RepID=A0AAV7WBU7_PLEWA|nr:hypothetical protein NDU88_005575 [Pleurodeles waltl]
MEVYGSFCASAGFTVGRGAGPAFSAGAPFRLSLLPTWPVVSGPARPPFKFSTSRSLYTVSGLGGLLVLGSRFGFCCCVSAEPPFCFTALLQHQGRWTVWSQLDLSRLPFLDVPGVPLCATGHSWRSRGSGIQDNCAKIGGHRELRFTRAAPSASSHGSILIT